MISVTVMDTYEDCFLPDEHWSYFCENTFSCSCFVVSLLIIHTVLCEINSHSHIHCQSHYFMWQLHIASLKFCLLHPGITIHHFHQASIRFGCRQSHYVLHMYLAITSYWFNSSILRFTFLPGFFEHLPPCHQAVGVILDGVTSRVRIVVIFFLWLVIHSTPAWCSFPFFLNQKNCMWVCILCLSLFYLQPQFQKS